MDVFRTSAFLVAAKNEWPPDVVKGPRDVEEQCYDVPLRRLRDNASKLHDSILRRPSRREPELPIGKISRRQCRLGESLHEKLLEEFPYDGEEANGTIGFRILHILVLALQKDS